MSHADVPPPALGSGYEEGWANCVATVGVLYKRIDTSRDWYQGVRNIYSKKK